MSGAPAGLGFPRPAWDSLLTAQLILTTVAAPEAGELRQVVAEIEAAPGARLRSGRSARGEGGAHD